MIWPLKSRMASSTLVFSFNAELGEEMLVGNKVLRDGKQIEGEVKDLSEQIQRLMTEDEVMAM
jgi:hypothetical protein